MLLCKSDKTVYCGWMLCLCLFWLYDHSLYGYNLTPENKIDLDRSVQKRSESVEQLCSRWKEMIEEKWVAASSDRDHGEDRLRQVTHMHDGQSGWERQHPTLLRKDRDFEQVSPVSELRRPSPAQWLEVFGQRQWTNPLIWNCHFLLTLVLALYLDDLASPTIADQPFVHNWTCYKGGPVTGVWSWWWPALHWSHRRLWLQMPLLPFWLWWQIFSTATTQPLHNNKNVPPLLRTMLMHFPPRK